MKAVGPSSPRVVIACGGTGGHFFPGSAVGEELREKGVETTLLISSKKVDQQAAQTQEGVDILEMPAVAFSPRQPLRFFSGFYRSMVVVRKLYRTKPPNAVLSMGGFTSVAPVLAGKLYGAKIFLHESNALPGRANRLLAPLADKVFVGFEMAKHRFLHTSVVLTGTPVRRDFYGLYRAVCCARLGLSPNKPILLVMGGSQGARAINQMVKDVLPALRKARPDLQYVHLSGDEDYMMMLNAYKSLRAKAVVRGFLDDMPVALGATDLALGRSGASSLAEMDAAQVSSVLIPLPTSADDHQRYNANNYSVNGAARVVEQSSGSGVLLNIILRQLQDRLDFCSFGPKQKTISAATRVASEIMNNIIVRRHNELIKEKADPSMVLT